MKMNFESNKYIPYGRHDISEEDIKTVVDVLRSDWLTTGPKIKEFEDLVSSYSGASFGVAVSSGTAALHAAMFALGIGAGDEVIVPAMTFAATANCVVYQGGRPIFADVDPDTLLIDPSDIEKKITNKTKAIIGVDYAGQPCDWNSLRAIAEKHGLFLVDDACHAIGAEYHGKKIGAFADITVFSFHPVKHITTGEGGMALTDNELFAERMRIFRNHGITTVPAQRDSAGTWFYEMVDLGYNYRITDIQCALGISQISKLDDWLRKRTTIADFYFRSLSENETVMPLHVGSDVLHAWHLYFVKIKNADRDSIFMKMRASGIGVNVHYIPVHLHPYYCEKFGTGVGHCPQAEAAYKEILSLPMHPGLVNDDQARVIETLFEAMTS